jgi:hypothetical protein
MTNTYCWLLQIYSIYVFTTTSLGTLIILLICAQIELVTISSCVQYCPSEASSEHKTTVCIPVVFARDTFDFHGVFWLRVAILGSADGSYSGRFRLVGWAAHHLPDLWHLSVCFSMDVRLTLAIDVIQWRHRWPKSHRGLLFGSVCHSPLPSSNSEQCWSMWDSLTCLPGPLLTILN